MFTLSPATGLLESKLVTSCNETKAKIGSALLTCGLRRFAAWASLNTSLHFQCMPGHWASSQLAARHLELKGTRLVP